MFPPVILCNLAALTIAVIYYGWRDGYARRRATPTKVLRERVAYMLWKAAQRSD
jgi:hypothetical protein